MVGVLIAVAVIHFASISIPMPVRSEWDEGVPHDPGVTPEAVRDYLDGKTVSSFSLNGSDGRKDRTITLRKERISSVKLRSPDRGQIAVLFELDLDGKKLPVQGSFRADIEGGFLRSSSKDWVGFTGYLNEDR